MTSSDRKARYSEQEKRLVYYLTPSQCRSIEVRSRAEAEELIEDSGVAQELEEFEFGDGYQYRVKTIEGRTSGIRADIYRDARNIRPFEVWIVTSRTVRAGTPNERKLSD